MAKSGKIGFKDSVSKFEELQRKIAARDFAPVYLLMGEESYFIDTIADLLASSILEPAQRDFNQTIAYGPDTDAGAIINLCRQMPMLGERQVVIVKEAQSLRKLDELALYTASPLASTVLVLCVKHKSLDKRTSLYKSINACGEVLESVRPYDSEIGPWLSGFVRSKGRRIDNNATAIIVNHLGTDISRISNELNKLFISLPENTAVITPADIERNIGISKTFNNFELCKAVTARNMAQAMLIADNFARDPKDNPFQVTLMALFRQFRQMFTVNCIIWQSRSRGVPMPDNNALCRALGIPSPFIAGEIRAAAAKWPNSRLFNVLGIIREYDARSKGIDTGGLSDGELLREMILKILA